MRAKDPKLHLAALAGILLAAAAAAQSAWVGEPPPPSNPYNPPPCAGNIFDDVTCSTGFDAWIEQYSRDQITAGCDANSYCPNDPVTRAQMAVFVEKAMRGTASWSPGELTGAQNTGLGSAALLNVTFTAFNNTGLGHGALGSVTTENDNTAVGADALAGNAGGNYNTAVGSGALNVAVDTSDNTAIGLGSLGATTVGFRNTALGYLSGTRNDMITAYNGSPIQLVANQTGSYNTWLGFTGATTQVNNCTAVGIDAYCDASDQVRVGNVFVNSIGGKVAWSTLSDARAKLDVEDLRHGLPFVLSLRPVTFRYKGGNGRTDMGFVAQDVEALLGEGYNVVDSGGDVQRTLSLRYTELIAPLVKAVQEQQEQIEAQQAQIEALRAEVAALRNARGETRED